MAKTYKPGKGYSRRDWDAVSDNPELTDEQMSKAKPFAEALPELAASIRRGRGPNKAPTKKLVSLRLSGQVLEKYKAGGPDGNRGSIKTCGGSTRSNEPVTRMNAAICGAQQNPGYRSAHPGYAAAGSAAFFPGFDARFGGS